MRPRLLEGLLPGASQQESGKSSLAPPFTKQKSAQMSGKWFQSQTKEMIY